MVDVFISYSKNDRERVSQLAKAIEREGYAVWWDEELPLHQSYGDVITEKIEHAKAAIVVWSPDAAASEWVRAEADTARNQKKLIQTALGDMVPPMPFNQVQCANLKDWDGNPDSDHNGWRKVRESLIALCGERDRDGAAGIAGAGAGAGGAAMASPPPASAPDPVPAPTSATATAPQTALDPAHMPPPDTGVPSAAGKSPSTPVLVGAGVGILVLLAGGMYALSSGGSSDAEDVDIAASDVPASGDDPFSGKPGDEGFVADQPPPVVSPAEQPLPAGGDEFNRDVNLVNQTGETIFYLYWSSVDDPNWGSDRLGAEILPAGQTWQVTADDGSGACQYDFMAETQSGRQIERRNVNVCAVWNISFE